MAKQKTVRPNAKQYGKRSASRANVTRARTPTNGEINVSEIFKDYCTTAEAAALLGIRANSVNHLIARGKLLGKQVGRTWLVYKPSIEEYYRTKATSGRHATNPPKLAATTK